MTIKGNVKLLLQKELHTPKYFIIFICESSAKIPDVYLSVCNYTLQTLPCTSTTIKSVTCPSKQAQNTQHFIWPNRKSKTMVMFQNLSISIHGTIGTQVMFTKSYIIYFLFVVIALTGAPHYILRLFLWCLFNFINYEFNNVFDRG